MDLTSWFWSNSCVTYVERTIWLSFCTTVSRRFPSLVWQTLLNLIQILLDPNCYRQGFMFEMPHEIQSGKTFDQPECKCATLSEKSLCCRRRLNDNKGLEFSTFDIIHVRKVGKRWQIPEIHDIEWYFKRLFGSNMDPQKRLKKTFFTVWINRCVGIHSLPMTKLALLVLLKLLKPGRKPLVSAMLWFRQPTCQWQLNQMATSVGKGELACTKLHTTGLRYLATGDLWPNTGKSRWRSMGSEHDKSLKVWWYGSEMGRGLVQHHEFWWAFKLGPLPLKLLLNCRLFPTPSGSCFRGNQDLTNCAFGCRWSSLSCPSWDGPLGLKAGIWMAAQMTKYALRFAQIPTSHLPSCSVFVLRCSTLLLTTHSTPQIDLFVLFTDWYWSLLAKNYWKIDRLVRQMLRSECRPKQRSI